MSFLAFQNDILRMIAKGDTLEATAERLCVHVETCLPGVTCSVLTVDSAGLLHPLAGPSLPQAFSAALNGLLIGPKVGSCGTAAYLREPVLVADIGSDPRWAKFRGMARGLGFTACCSTPICDEAGATIAVFALYFRASHQPRDDEQEVIAAGVDMLSLALQRHERVADRERRAMIDALTGLPNRRAFNAALAQVPCDDPGAWALMILDLDNLKVVNDTFGHQAGDTLIATVAQRIARAMQPDVTFRLGGDEFAILIQDGDRLRDLDATAQRIFTALEQPAECDGNVIVPMATIGGAVFAPGDEDARVVRQNADFALYHAKETGRGGFVRYWPGIGTRITHRRTAIRDVTSALAEGRIDAHYQPIVRLDSTEIVGLEALCRLKTNDGDVLTAASFLDATSDARVASELTQRMFSVVAGDMRRWIDAGHELPHVGINISTADFHAGKLIEQLETSFGEQSVPLSHLVLEMTDNVYLGPRDRPIVRGVKELRARGVRVALDDFGTGAGSLTQLLTVPVDIIKIDRSFVARLWPDDPSLSIVEGLIEIGRKLGIEVIAEGIETEVQASQLWTMGCKFGQGYAFAGALGRDGILELLRRHAHTVAGATPIYERMRRAPAPESGVAELRPTGSD